MGFFQSNDEYPNHLPGGEDLPLKKKVSSSIEFKEYYVFEDGGFGIKTDVLAL